MSTLPRISGISDFADEFLGGGEGEDLTRVGPATEVVGHALGVEQGTALIATAFWQIFTRSPAFDRALEDVDLRRQHDPRDRELLVVAHPLAEDTQPRYDLVVLDARLRDREPISTDAEWHEDDLAVGWKALEEDLNAYRDINPDAVFLQLLNNPEIVSEAAGTDSFRILFAGLPETISSSGAPQPETYAAFPSPSWIARRYEDSEGEESRDYGTAGMVDINGDGQLGVTVSHHLLASGGPEAVEIGTPVVVNDILGHVVSSHIPSDSCFVQLQRVERNSGLVEMEPALAGRAEIVYQQTRAESFEAANELLSGIFPRQSESTVFEGALSGRQQVKVLAWSPDLLVVLPNNMCKLFTEALTGGGDSGAALRDYDGRLLGFAFARSEYGETPEYSSWIWAESVARAHNLTALLEISSAPIGAAGPIASQ